MKRKLLFSLLCMLLLVTTACSANRQDSSRVQNNSEETEMADQNYDEDVAYDNVSEESNSESIEEIDATIAENRMIIHQAQLSLNVKDIEKVQLKVEEKVKYYGGYIVESNVYQGDEEHIHGYLTVRIPEKHFTTFLNETEDEAADILERTVTGEDVTEQYVDLDSRLKSKRVVEERLLDFMSDAKKTEDLLAISNDLATIQEEIEVIVGKMNYLDNQVNYSTVEISMYENRVIVPELDSQQLNTWENTKKQLAVSMNFLLTAGSSLIVFFIGNLPIFIILFVIGMTIYLFYKKKTSGK